MKAYFMNILMFAGIFLLYKLGVFGAFSGFGIKIATFILVCVLLVLGLFVFGNPFKGGDGDENK